MKHLARKTSSLLHDCLLDISDSASRLLNYAASVRKKPEKLSPQERQMAFRYWIAYVRPSSPHMPADEFLRCPFISCEHQSFTTCQKRYPSLELLLKHVQDCLYWGVIAYRCPRSGQVETIHVLNRKKKTFRDAVKFFRELVLKHRRQGAAHLRLELAADMSQSSSLDLKTGELSSTPIHEICRSSTTKELRTPIESQSSLTDDTIDRDPHTISPISPAWLSLDDEHIVRAEPKSPMPRHVELEGPVRQDFVPAELATTESNHPSQTVSSAGGRASPYDEGKIPIEYESQFSDRDLPSNSAQDLSNAASIPSVGLSTLESAWHGPSSSNEIVETSSQPEHLSTSPSAPRIAKSNEISSTVQQVEELFHFSWIINNEWMKRLQRYPALRKKWPFESAEEAFRQGLINLGKIFDNNRPSSLASMCALALNVVACMYLQQKARDLTSWQELFVEISDCQHCISDAEDRRIYVDIMIALMASAPDDDSLTPNMILTLDVKLEARPGFYGGVDEEETPSSASPSSGSKSFFSPLPREQCRFASTRIMSTWLTYITGMCCLPLLS